MIKKLWIRRLSCGHERPTNVLFLTGIYKKPKVGDFCYCRECCREVKILGVKESSKKQMEELEKWKKSKIKSGKKTKC